MKIDVLSLFPGMFSGVFEESIIKRAINENKVSINIHNFRDFSLDPHNKVDDTPYGGGAGMVLTCQPIFDCVKSLRSEDSIVILLTPDGEVYKQERAYSLAGAKHLIMICGHYEGFDERIRHLATDHISIGDYVLTGGELPSMVMSDAIVRLLPEVLGNEGSAQFDSFSHDLLEHPHYTRPAEFKGMKVPEVLTSGNHALIEEWRDKESLRRTYQHRPDLLEGIELSGQQKSWLKEFKENQ